MPTIHRDLRVSDLALNLNAKPNYLNNFCQPTRPALLLAGHRVRHDDASRRAVAESIRPTHVDTLCELRPGC